LTENFTIMALKIRLQRHGASHRPFYRMVVTEASARRDGRFVEVLGTYEPQAKRAEDELNLKLDRIDYWNSVGAKATDTAASLIRKVRRQAAEVSA
jgi:small subunit ribosomal protein S16